MHDLSAAFDVIDRGIHQKHLARSSGTTGSSLPWTQSFLSDRIQSLTVGTSTLERKCGEFRLPEELVLEPSECCVYFKTTSAIYQRHNLRLPKKIWVEVSSKPEVSSADFGARMSARALKLNQEET